MKYNDYRRLGKISIKSRKKSTRNTVRGISFGLIIIIPIIFFTLAFYLDLTNKINDVNTISSFEILTKHYTNDSGDSIITGQKDYNSITNGMLGYDRLESITNLKGVDDYLVSEYIDLSNLYEENYGDIEPPQTSFIINGNKISLPHFQDYYDPWGNDNQNLSTRFKFLHQDLSSATYITQAEENDLNNHFNINNVFIAGEGFKGDGKQQIIVSERFIKKFNINIEDILNKTVSLEFIISEKQSSFIDTDFDPNNEFDYDNAYNYYYEHFKGKSLMLFEDFEVVGIVSEKLYKLQSREGEADFWFHNNSLYNDESYYPDFKLNSIQLDEYWTEEYWVITYESDPLTIATDITSEGMVFIPIGFGASFSNEYYLYPYPLLTTIVQCDNYHNATIVESSIKAIYDFVYGETYHDYSNSSYSFFSVIYKTGFYIILILLSFGGIIFFATLLNLYNSINYSVQSRRNYIGVMRAIGARESLVPKLYFVEVMLIFMRAFVWILIFSGLISYGIKALVDSGFNYIAEDLGLNLKLSFLYFPLTIILMVLIEFTIAFVYSQVACRNVSKKPILEILKDEK